MSEIFHNGRPPHVDRYWLSATEHTLMETIDLVEQSGARQWIELMRAAEPNGRLDCQSTAQNLGIPLTYSQSITGVYRGQTENLITGNLEDIRLVINPIGTERGRERLTFGHEVGHVFLSHILGQTPHLDTGYVPEEENFCELFGHLMAIPSSYLEDIVDLDEVAIKSLIEQHGMNLGDIITRLMLEGKLPPKVAIDSRISPNTPNKKYANKVSRDYICLSHSSFGVEQCDSYGEDIKVLILQMNIGGVVAIVAMSPIISGVMNVVNS